MNAKILIYIKHINALTFIFFFPERLKVKATIETTKFAFSFSTRHLLNF